MHRLPHGWRLGPLLLHELHGRRHAIAVVDGYQGPHVPVSCLSHLQQVLVVPVCVHDADVQRGDVLHDLRSERRPPPLQTPPPHKHLEGAQLAGGGAIPPWWGQGTARSRRGTPPAAAAAASCRRSRARRRRHDAVGAGPRLHQPCGRHARPALVVHQVRRHFPHTPLARHDARLDGGVRAHGGHVAPRVVRGVGLLILGLETRHAPGGERKQGQCVRCGLCCRAATRTCRQQC